MSGFTPDTGPRPGALTSKEAVRTQLYVILAGLDVFAIISGFVVTGWYRQGTPFGGEAIVPALVVAFSYFIYAVTGRAFSIDSLRHAPTGIVRALRSLLFAVCTVFVVAFFLKASEDLSRVIFAAGLATGGGALVAGRFAVDWFIERRLDRRFVDEIVIAEAPVDGLPIGTRVLNAATHGLNPDSNDPHMLDRLSRLVRYSDRVVVFCRPDQEDAWAHVLKGLDIQSEIRSPRFDVMGVHAVGHFAGHPTMVVSAGPLSLPRRALKRALDIAVSVPALILLAPGLLMIGIAIRSETRGPMLFRQQRMGHGNRLFWMYKFRSMRVESSDHNGTRSAGRDDDRVTRVGNFIRRTSIDELPQLLNVVRGDMSLVGPRPHALGSTVDEQLFWHVVPHYWHRHRLKPGITGLAQVRGFRGATALRRDLTDRLDADLEYVSNWSLMKDFMILFATLGVIVHRNAY